MTVGKQSSKNGEKLWTVFIEISELEPDRKLEVINLISEEMTLQLQYRESQYILTYLDSKLLESSTH